VAQAITDGATPVAGLYGYVRAAGLADAPAAVAALERLLSST
jgi:hypothetical protein